MSVQELSEKLGAFYSKDGETFPWSILYPNFKLTLGAKFLADNTSGLWLMDTIASYQKYLLPVGQYFQVWRMAINSNKTAAVVCDDGNGKELVRFELAQVTFPLSMVKLYVSSDGENLTIRLPQEF